MARPEGESPLNITVIGLGRLGAVAASGLAAAGHRVTGLDVDERRVKALREGRMPFYEPGIEESVASSVSEGKLRFLHNDDMAEDLAGVALITAGTPSTANGGVDLRQVRAALAWVKSRNPRDLVLVMKSTVPPGSGVEFLRKDLLGTDADYVANPEFLREGRALHDWRYPDRIVLRGRMVRWEGHRHRQGDVLRDQIPLPGHGHHQRGDDQVRQQRIHRHPNFLHQRNGVHLRRRRRLHRRR